MCIRDRDNDGDKDIVLGNWGKNSKLSASAERPLELYVKDFDNNQKTDLIFNWYAPLEKKLYPFASKMDITAQMPHLKKRILKYEEYAKLDYQNLFTDQEKAGAMFKQTKELSNAILRNGENGWKLEALPHEAQIAPVFAVELVDLNGDDRVDILLGGNFHGLKPEMGRQDSGRGLVLLQKEDGNFQALSPEESGLNIRGEIRDVTILRDSAREPIFLIARNDDTLLAYRLNIE